MTLEKLEDYFGALAALEASRLEDEHSTVNNPRIRCTWHYTLTRVFLGLGRAQEAEQALRDTLVLAAQIGDDLDRLRCRWLEAAVDRACGRTRQALTQENGRNSRVRAILRALKPIFDALELKREALLTYRLLVRSVESDAASIAMVRALARSIALSR